MGIGDFFNGAESSWPVIRFAVVVLLIIVLGIFIWGSRSNILLGMTFALSIILFLPYLAELMTGGLVGLLMAARFGSEKWNDIKSRADRMKQWSKEQVTAARKAIEKSQTDAKVSIAEWFTQSPAAKAELISRLKNDITELQSHRVKDTNDGIETDDLDNEIDAATKLLAAANAAAAAEDADETKKTEAKDESVATEVKDPDAYY